MPHASGLPVSVALAGMLLAGVACSTPAVTSETAAGTAVSAAVASMPTASPALPRADDLTFADSAGKVLIGLTVRPALPGPNTLLVYVLPVAGPSVAADVPLSLAVNGQSLSVDTCSRTCRMADVMLDGGEHVDIVAGGAAGGTATFELPRLPAPDGAALLAQVQSRMHQLHSYRVDETLGPASPLVRANYTFVAPDRMALRLPTGPTTVWVGPTRYTEESDSGPWQAENFGTSLPVPSFVWDTPASGGTYVGAHVVGTAMVDGVQTQVLTFFLDLPQIPAWFRLWSDATGLVHRAAMRAQGHFMAHRYTDFDSAISIEPPS